MHKHEITLDLNSFVFRLGYLRKFIGSYHVDELILLDSRERIYIYIYDMYVSQESVDIPF